MPSTNERFEKEKEKLLSIVKSTGSDKEFSGITSQDSYYIPYKESKHCEAPIVEFNSGDITEIRKRLSDMWSGTPMEKTIPVFLAGINKSKEESENYLQKIDLHNYMM